jgi:hypothetical protein
LTSKLLRKDIVLIEQAWTKVRINIVYFAAHNSIANEKNTNAEKPVLFSFFISFLPDCVRNFRASLSVKGVTKIL